jgi:CRISPR-associated endonuclease Csn1
MTETMGQKFSIGLKGNKVSKYVEAAKGTNLFFAVYSNDDGIRSFTTIPLNIVIERLKQHLSPVPERNEKGDNLLFYLSPGDLVYVPMSDEINIDKINSDRIYKFVSCTSNEAHFIPSQVATPILQTTELGSNNKSQRAWSKEMIKEICIPLSINRLGEIKRK